MILLVLFVLLMSGLFGKIGGWMNLFFSKNNCEKEVLSHVKMLELTNGKKVLPIDCPTIIETIPGETEEEIKFQIAERMKKMWGVWQEGGKNLFGKDKAVYCHTQYILDFENKNVDINNFNKYLAETPVPNQDYSYLQYLSGFTNNEEFSIDVLKDNSELSKVTDQFKTDSRKAIIFVYVKDRDAIKELLNGFKNFGLGAGMGAGVGVVVAGVTGVTCLVGSIASFGALAVPCGTLAMWTGISAGIPAMMAGGIMGVTVSEDYPLWMAQAQLREYNAEEFENLECEIAPIKQTNK
ncbi:MAG: hypothetical protein KKF89_05230 [Nanoarchaeota archaeon]|nr:hypothetical protein [Nanoarchaeota archaeon]